MSSPDRQARRVPLFNNFECERAYPDIVVDLTTTEESRLDLVAAGFDAGASGRFFVERDMVVVPSTCVSILAFTLSRCCG